MAILGRTAVRMPPRSAGAVHKNDELLSAGGLTSAAFVGAEKEAPPSTDLAKKIALPDGLAPPVRCHHVTSRSPLLSTAGNDPCPSATLTSTGPLNMFPDRSKV